MRKWLLVCVAVLLLLSAGCEDKDLDTPAASFAWGLLKQGLALAGNLMGDDNEVIGVVSNFVQNSGDEFVDACKDRDFAKIRGYGKSLGLEVSETWLIDEGGWKVLWTRADRVAPHLTEAIYRVDEFGLESGVLPRAAVSLHADGRLSYPSAGTLLREIGNIELSATDEDWFIRTLADEIAAVRLAKRDADE